MKMRIRIILTALLVICALFVGCTPNNQMQMTVPQPQIDKVGHSILVKEDEAGKKIITYAFVGLKDDVVVSLYLDQIEKDSNGDRHFSTNKEKGDSYGLAYESEHGEWYKQIEALENYIIGNKMTIRDINNIPVRSHGDSETMFPEEGSDLEAACGVDISEFIKAINEAHNNLKLVDAMEIAAGENVRISNNEGGIEVDFVFVAIDYKHLIQFADIENYVITFNGDKRVYKTSNDGYARFILGLSIREACNIETYDVGNGVDTAVPRKDTELAKFCQTDLSGEIRAMEDIKKRLYDNQ